MQKRNYEIQILVNGQRVREYEHKNKVYIEGREGTEFSIRIKNNGFVRILAVPTVDGLSAIDGKVASFKSQGYIIDGYNSVIVDGWRTSKDDVAKFIFCDKDKSYAAKAGKNGNEGVIGVAVFREVDTWPSFTYTGGFPYWDDFPSTIISDTNTITIDADTNTGTTLSNVSCSTQCCSNSDLGTGWGEEKHSPVHAVNFKREESPDALFEIFYNSRKQLEKMGIDVKKGNSPRYISSFPNENQEFCQPPENN